MVPKLLRSQQWSPALTDSSSPLYSVLDHTLRKTLGLSIDEYPLLYRRHAGLVTLPEQRPTCKSLAERHLIEPQGVCMPEECQCCQLTHAGAVIYEAATAVIDETIAEYRPPVAPLPGRLRIVLDSCWSAVTGCW
jgi:hypothetical protein